MYPPIPANHGEMVEQLRFSMPLYPENEVIIRPTHGYTNRAAKFSITHAIPEDPAEWASYSAELTAFSERATQGHEEPITGAMLFVVPKPTPYDAFQQAADAVQPLAAALQHDLRTAGIPVSAAICIAGGLWRAYDCPDHRCCRDEPRSTHTIGRLTRYYRDMGMEPAHTRAHVESQLLPIQGSEATKFSTLLAQKNEHPADCEYTPGPWMKGTEEKILRALQMVTNGQPLPAELAAAAIGYLQEDLELAFSMELVESEIRHAHELWHTLVRKCVPPYEHMSVPLLTLLSWTAQHLGDRALAQVAYERALRLDPAHELARQMRVTFQKPQAFTALRNFYVGARRAREDMQSRIVQPAREAPLRSDARPDESGQDTAANHADPEGR